MKAFIVNFSIDATGNWNIGVSFSNAGILVKNTFVPINVINVLTTSDIYSLVVTAILSYSTTQGYGLIESDIIWMQATPKYVQDNVSAAVIALGGLI